MALEFTGERYVPSLRGQIYYEHIHRYALAAPYCAGRRVLDVASGEGYGSALLARGAAEVTGVDIDEASIEHSRRSYYLQNLRFLHGSCTELPLPDASVDVVVSFETIEHISDPERMLDEIRRVLVPGGLVVLSSPNKLVYSDLSGLSNPYHLREMYFAEFRDVLQRRFRHVVLHGQQLVGASVVYPLGGGATGAPAWYSPAGASIGATFPVLNDPIYFVALCSDAEIADDAGSAFIDAHDDLLADLWTELRTLRQRNEIALANPAPPANEPLAITSDPAAGQAADGAVLDGLRAEFEAREATLRAQLTGEFEDLRRAAEADAEALRARLNEEDERGRHLATMIEDLRREARRSTESALAATARLSEERSRAAELANDLQRAQTLADSARADAERQRARVAELAKQLARMRDESVQLHEILGSRSWRMTAPLRTAFRIARSQRAAAAGDGT